MRKLLSWPDSTAGEEDHDMAMQGLLTAPARVGKTSEVYDAPMKPKKKGPGKKPKKVKKSK